MFVGWVGWVAQINDLGSFEHSLVVLTDKWGLQQWTSCGGGEGGTYIYI